LHYLYQEGRTVFRYAVTNMSAASALIAERNGLNKDNIAWVVPHQANIRIIEAVAKRLELPMEKVMLNIQRYGNTSAATLPLALWDYEAQLKKGDNLIFTAFGAGFTYGAVYLKWGYDGAAAAAPAK
jgi:3-oxoacyl-[acyl-carrier-protein] synthase-3